jgi:cell division protein FtsW
MSRWWWSVDRWLLFAIGLLMIAGIVFGLAGGPPVAERLGYSTYHFVNRQAAYLVPAAIVLVIASLATPHQVRRVAGLVYVVSLILVIATLFVGTEVKGARRWINLPFGNIQPSEFLKPAFVVICAWLFSEGARGRATSGMILAFLLLPLTIVPLVMQPDVGQTMLLVIVWVALFFVAGLHMVWVLGLGGMTLAGLVGAYLFIPHVTHRIDRFLDPGAGDTFQVDTAIESFVAGGWFGKGPGEGTVKRHLPDAHTDFIFAVTAEEFGIFVCLGIVMVFALIVLRTVVLAARNEDAFCRLAAAGLVALFGVQAAINMAVNVHLMPAKGMTLPFISYGGSSLISLALGMGFLLAVTRKRPKAEIVGRLTPGARLPLGQRA